MACSRFLVSGRVQGVWFRASTRELAQRLQLTGHAVNLADGSVEVVACGSEAALEELAAWLQHGPEQAHVTAVICEPLSGHSFDGFSVG
ncbi:MAG: acylphosphatase [Gammaproteobacteria bacterium]|nr:acylphosphatase [Gammaproteobacteria bacterium]